MRSTPAFILSRIAILSAAAAIFASGSFAPVTQAQAPAAADVHQPHGPSTAPLKISIGDKSSEWTATSIAALPHVIVSVYNEHAKAQQTYSGVPLTVLLTKLGVPEKPHGKEFRLYLVADGSDGYQVVYSVGEVTPDVHDGTTLVADSVDGKPLGDNGIFQLVTTGEKRPARWVRNLVAIRVMTAQ